MKKIIYPEKKDWVEILRRPALNTDTLRDTVKEVLDKVKTEGDKAVREYEERFDKVKLDLLGVTETEIAEAEKEVPIELKAAIMLAQKNIHTFHNSQRFEGKKVQTVSGVTCWQKAVAIEKVGLYIPGGTAPLFSTVLMLATPAQIAGCKEIVLCTPPDKEGKVHPAILYAAKLAGVNKIFKAGGVQAIAAMAYGTESVPKVYKIFGPGNQYVTAAKQQVSLRDVAIDMPAGPSEVEVLADETANPVFVAADLLSQAEHGVDSQAMLITTSEKLMKEVEYEVQRQLALLTRWKIAASAFFVGKLLSETLKHLGARVRNGINRMPHTVYKPLLVKFLFIEKSVKIGTYFILIRRVSDILFEVLHHTDNFYIGTAVLRTLKRAQSSRHNRISVGT